MTSRIRAQAVGVAVASLLALATVPAHASSVLARTVVDLIDLSQHILVGEVLQVRDDFNPHGVPYTEVTLRVDEAVKGITGDTYTFRQFGLMSPRTMPDGRVNLNVTPDGWPRYRSGESVVLFLYKPGELTGLRTTVGLFQGKFELREDGLTNAAGNRGLFRGVKAPLEDLNDAEKKLVRAGAGPVDADTFVSFVRKTVRNRWVEQGRVYNEN